MRESLGDNLLRAPLPSFSMPDPLLLFADQLTTPIGILSLVTDAAGDLRVALFTGDEEPLRRQLRLQYGDRGYALSRAQRPLGVTAEVARYFAGDLEAIDRIRVATGGTAFQREVWQALRKIPCGSTTSYSELARSIGRPAAVRAVGLANGANPVAVVVPCHRVIGANGSLTGYGGGIDRKRWLLDHEKSGALF
jgi:methylated-DNA-[protein]-cysteine S-methyltransferase